MMNIIRKYLGSWFLAIVVGFIALVFVFWGIFPDARNGGVGGTGGNTIAQVGSERISVRDLQSSVQRELESYKQMGQELPAEYRQMLYQQTLNRMIQQKLITSEAKRLGLMVSDTAVMAEIQKMPYFLDKEKKTFSVDLYRNILASNGMTPAIFENMLRDDLTYQQMVRFLQSRIRVTDKEVEREYMLTGDQRNLTYIRLARDYAYKKMTVTPEELQKFLSDPSKVNLVQTNYDQHKQKYMRGEEVCARHILKRTAPPKAGEKAPDASNPPADFLALKPNAGNFAAIAMKSSEDPGSSKQGGELGCFGSGVMDPAFEKGAFATAVGSVSKPIKSDFGWHYIYVYKKNPAVNVPFEKAKTEIAQDMIKGEKLGEVQKINQTTGQEMVKAWAAGGAKAAAAVAGAGVEVRDTGYFNRIEGTIPGIGRAPEIINAAFSSEAAIQKGPQLFESQGSVIVAMVKEKKVADLKNFEKEKDVQVKTLTTRKLQSFLPAWMEDLNKQHKVKISDSAIKELGSM